MIGLIISAFLISLSLLSCSPGQYGSKQGVGTTQAAGNPAGHNPTNYNGDPNTTSTNSCAHGKWGGVTCNSNYTTNDPQFLEYLSNGTDTREGSSSIGYINCKPSNSGGILFQMKVILSGPFDPNGNNTNLLMQIASSSLEMIIYDDKQGATPIGAKFNGLQGQVNGNSATLKFDYTGKHGRKELTLEGTFDSNVFTGNVHFKNEKRIVPQKKGSSAALQYTTPGASGLLGNFRIPTCHVFVST